VHESNSTCWLLSVENARVSAAVSTPCPQPRRRQRIEPVVRLATRIEQLANGGPVLCGLGFTNVEGLERSGYSHGFVDGRLWRIRFGDCPLATDVKRIGAAAGRESANGADWPRPR
jgi:hypothetical protein